MAPQSNGGGEKNEFDDLISALRTGDVFGENMDKFRRNRFVFRIINAVMVKKGEPRLREPAFWLPLAAVGASSCNLKTIFFTLSV